jgi:hypothetical protein
LAVVKAHLTWSLGLVLALSVPGGGGSGLRPSDPPGARMIADPRKGEMVIELAPVDLPAHASHHEVTQPPVAMLEVPTGGSIYGFRLEVLDWDGRSLPADIVHHFNLIDPDHRELFLPISRRLLAAGKETGEQRLPWLLFGLPLERGSRVLASVMVQNPTPTAHRGVRVRLVMPYVPDRRPWPFFRVFPWQLDVAFPVGDKSFDLPPGRSSKSYEGSPAVPGTVVALGGHVHDLAQAIEFADVTTGEVIYRAAPVRDSSGQVVAVPIGRLYRWNRLGARIVPEHRYRVTVYYDNPTGAVIPDGGMGVVGGIFVPDGGAPWPAANPADSIYQRDLRHAMRLVGGEHDMKMHHTMGHHSTSP